MNLHLINGNVGADPELRTTQGGTSVTNVRVATHSYHKDNQGKRTERTEWHRVVIFGKGAELFCKYAGKGSLVHIQGPSQTRKWSGEGGQPRYTTEIICKHFDFLSTKKPVSWNDGDTPDIPVGPAPIGDDVPF